MKIILILWFAQGFGVGRIPVAPGTSGSLVGLLWFVLLLATENFWIYLAGCVAGFFLSVWLCGAGEKILRQRDPGSIVMDEIAAIPVCAVGWAFREWQRHGQLPPPAEFLSSARGWLFVAVLFLAFRLFDIWKPWPVRQSQSLPAGWGVTVDDFLAAGYVNLALLPFWF